MSILVELDGLNRENKGKGAARALRRAKQIPAIIYGGQKSEVLLSLPEKDLTLLYNKHGFMSHLYEVKVSGKNYKALVKHVQLHPVTDKIEHIDFIHVSEGSKIKVKVPLEFLNQDVSVGIKRGGVLNVAKFDIEIECSATSIPEQIEVDVADLNIGETIHIKDIKFGKGVSAILDGESTVCAIVGRTDEKEEAQPATTESK
jgi:large subunit ribosomal protein L25